MSFVKRLMFSLSSPNSLAASDIPATHQQYLLIQLEFATMQSLTLPQQLFQNWGCQYVHSKTKTEKEVDAAILHPSCHVGNQQTWVTWLTCEDTPSRLLMMEVCLLPASRETKRKAGSLRSQITSKEELRVAIRAKTLVGHQTTLLLTLWC